MLSLIGLFAELPGEHRLRKAGLQEARPSKAIARSMKDYERRLLQDVVTDYEQLRLYKNSINPTLCCSRRTASIMKRVVSGRWRW